MRRGAGSGGEKRGGRWGEIEGSKRADGGW